MHETGRHKETNICYYEDITVVQAWVVKHKKGLAFNHLFLSRIWPLFLKPTLRSLPLSDVKEMQTSLF